ncbi:MAG TPA: hypothetical protein VGK74_00640 [Symbiobacteriaceae bacterium]
MCVTCKNGTTSFTITDLILPTNTATVAGVECAITNATCAEIERNQAGGGIAVVTIRKQVTFDLTFVDANGNPIPVTSGGTLVTTQTRTRFFDEFVQVCAPTGTTVNCEITNAGCRAILAGGTAVVVDIFLCQSIQVEAEVKVCVDIIDFCVPDICQQNPKPFACPPSEFFPPQCDPADPRFTPPCNTDTSSS